MPTSPKHTTPKHTTRGQPRLAEKTVQELRALAKSLGLTKYSNLPKAQLLRLIAAASPSAHTAPSKVATKTSKKKQAAQRRPQDRAVPASAPPVTRKPRMGGRPATRAAASKVHVAKVTTVSTPPGDEKNAASAFPDTTPLPPPAAPMLTLRGQKPGVLHAAWSIDPSRSMPLPYLRLRILKANADNTGVIDEVSLPDLQGSRYFHLAAEFCDTPLRAEIGYQSSDGRFIVMRQHAEIRLPSRLAAGRGDPQWWIGETDFSELYLRSGGTAEDSALVWRSSFSSR